MSHLPRAFPITVSTSDPACRVILKMITDLNRERRGTPKHVCCLTTITGSVTGVHISISEILGDKLFSTRYVEHCDCYLLQVSPKIFSHPNRMKQVAHEILAMMRRGVREWIEKDRDGNVVRTCRNAYGLSPDLKKKSERQRHWDENKHTILENRRKKHRKERGMYSIAHC